MVEEIRAQFGITTADKEAESFVNETEIVYLDCSIEDKLPSQRAHDHQSGVVSRTMDCALLTDPYIFIALGVPLRGSGLKVKARHSPAEVIRLS